MQVCSERTLKLRKSHFNVEFAVRNLQKIEHIPKQGLFKLIQTKALKMAVFANGGVLAGLKIHHFQGFTVPVLDTNEGRSFRQWSVSIRLKVGQDLTLDCE